MSVCARCGLEQDAGELTRSGVCALPQERRDACKDRQIANLHSLLRSVTGKLERAIEYLQSAQDESNQLHVQRTVARAELEVTSVLEALS